MINLQNIFAQAAEDNDTLSIHYRNNIIWQALNEDPSFLLPNSHSGYAIAEKLKLKKQKDDKDRLFFQLLILSISTVTDRIDKALNDLREIKDCGYSLLNIILNDINDVQEAIELLQKEHVIAAATLNYNDSEKLLREQTLEIEAIRNIYERYSLRGCDMHYPLKEIIRDQLEFEQHSSIPELIKKQSELGKLYNRSVKYCETLNENIKNYEIDYQRTLDGDPSQEQLDGLLEINTALKDVTKHSKQDLKSLQTKRQSIISDIEESIENDVTHDVIERKLMSTALDIKSFGL